MRFKLGKPKEKRDKDKVDVAIKDIAAERIEKMEQRIYGRARDLEEKAQQIQGLAEKSDDITARPHGPISELTLDTVDKSSDVMRVVKLNDSDDSDEDEDTVKLVEVSAINAPTVKAAPAKVTEAKAAPGKPPEAAKEAQPDEDSDSLGNLFKQQEDEVNPLANLIHSLPDVTVEELAEDLNEIKRIIKEWQKK
jgi:hypothetical protein